jgi:hypothetical protein
VPKPALTRACLAFILSLAVTAPGTAQDQTESQVVVVGKRNLDQEITDFVTALTPPSGPGQLSRFESEICPGAGGFDPQIRAALVERMRRVARAVDLRVGGPKCLPNTLLLATRDKRVLIETLARRHPAFLDGLSKSEIRRLAESPGPAAAWQILGRPRNADGMELAPEDYGGASGVYINRTTRPPSRITQAARRPTFAAVVVIETAALEGLSVTQVADYATMRTLLRADPGKVADSTTPTILRAIETPMGSAAPVSLTRWDMGLLRAYYQTRPELRANAQRSEIRRDLGEALAADKPGK